MAIIISIDEDPDDYIGYSLLVKLEEGDTVKGENIEEGINEENRVYNGDYLYYTYRKKMPYSFKYTKSDYELNDTTLRRFNYYLKGLRDCYEAFGTIECISDIGYPELKYIFNNDKNS